jgi:hypothetical protein
LVAHRHTRPLGKYVTLSELHVGQRTTPSGQRISIIVR